MKSLFWDSEGVVETIKQLLQKDTVILAEGDTVLGLLANISDRGYCALDKIKKRSKKPYLLLVKDTEKAFSFIEKEASCIFQIEKLVNICWPGPATLIFKAKTTVPLGVKSPEGNVAIRVPDHQGLQQLLNHFDALYSTSANTSGKPAPASIDQVEESIMHDVTEVVRNPSENQSHMDLPSTIIDCTGSTLKIVRQGAFPVEKLKDFL